MAEEDDEASVQSEWATDLGPDPDPNPSTLKARSDPPWARTDTSLGLGGSLVKGRLGEGWWDR